jgi:hypothetical protein
VEGSQGAVVERPLETRQEFYAPTSARVAFDRLWRMAAFVFAACTACMILSLPLFPSQDGPIHLYYVDVLRGLLTHSGPYPQYFAIKSYVTPYMLEYFSLMGLESVFSPLVSEKILLCIYVLLFVFGIRYLLGALSNRPGVWTFVGALFCLNLYIYMGFLNYALGSALVMFLAGFWLRWMKDLTPRRMATLAGGFVLLALTHPLPPAVFVSFASLHLVVTVFYEPDGLRAGIRNHRRPFVAALAMWVAAGLWVLHFAGTTRRASVPDQGSTDTFKRVIYESIFRNLEPVDLGLSYRFLLVALVAIAAIGVLLALSDKRERASAGAVSVIAFALVFFLVSCLAPESINGTGYFSTRFSIYWVVFLIAGAAALRAPRWCTVAAGVVAIPAAVILLYAQWHYLANNARALQAAIEGPPAKPGSLGAVIEDGQSPGVVTINPYMWGSAHYFRESQAILTNAPWLDLKFIMLRPKQLDPWTYENYPDFATQEILDTLNRRGPVDLDLLVRYGEDGPKADQVVERLGLQPIHSTPQLAIFGRSSVRP